MRKMMWQRADFCGVEVLTYAVIGNHVHMVVRVPVKDSIEAANGVAGAAGIPAIFQFPRLDFARSPGGPFSRPRPDSG